MDTLLQKLGFIQSELSVNKARVNEFGGFCYRSCEDILEALKPLLKETGCVLLLSDDLVEIGGRFYIKSTVSLADGTDKIETHAFAREALSRPKMDDAQVTGGCSSYARKYALCGLFCIDDSRADPDSRSAQEFNLASGDINLSSLNTKLVDSNKPTQSCLKGNNNNNLYQKDLKMVEGIGSSLRQVIANCKTLEDLKKVFKDYPNFQKNKEFTFLLSTRREEIEKNEIKVGGIK